MDDLIDIWAFLAEDSPSQADRLVDEIHGHFLPLLDQSGIGAPREALAPGLRVTFCRRYAIYYTHDDAEAVIIRVVHGARDRERLFETGD